MIKLVVFDIGKVVWNHEPFIDYFLKRIARISHKKLIEVRTCHHTLCRDFETDKLTLSSWASNYLHCSPARIAAELEHSFDLFYQNNLDLAVLSIIKNLRPKKIKVAYLSNVQNFMSKCFTRAGLLNNFDFGIFSFQAKLRKPAKAIYQQIFNYGAWLPEEVVFIDDQPINVETANSLGLIGLNFVNSQQLIKDLKKILTTI